MADGNGNEALRESEARRLNLLSEIGQRRNSTVIAYLTSVRRGIGGEGGVEFDDTRVIEPHVRAARQMGARNIDLFLMTEGGHAVVPWDLVAMVREYFPHGHFRVLLPSVAYSAGALICLGADEIVMSMASAMGPVDIQFPWSNGNGHLFWRTTGDFQGFLDLIRANGIAVRFSRKRLMDWLTAQSDVAAVGSLYRLWKENQRLVANLLGGRRAPLSRSQNQRIARFMQYGVGSHGQSIRRTEARANGISFITDAEKTGLDTSIDTLFAVYSDVMQLNTPYVLPTDSARNTFRRGDEADYDVEGRHFSETPVAIVESLHDTNPAYIAYDLRHWNKAPPLGPASEPAESDFDFESFAAIAPRTRRSFAPARFVSARTRAISASRAG